MKLFLSDDTVQVSLVENQYTIANVDDAVKVVYSNTTAEGTSVEQQYDTEVNEAAGVTYVGQAPPGTATSEPLWRIKRITETAGGSSVNWAGGNADFLHVWDNHLNLAYGP